MIRVRASVAVAFALMLVSVSVVSLHSGFVFLWWGLLAVGCERLVFGPQRHSRQLGVYVFYSFMALIVYLAQKWAIPGYYGFSGGIGVGTDDSYFYSLAAYNLPHDFPYRFAIAVQQHHFGDVLKVLVAVHRRIFPGIHPLDLLFFNTFGLSFLPLFTKELYGRLVTDPKGQRVAFVTMLLAPYVMANGVILMRDGWVAALFAGCLWAALSRRWLILGLCLAGVSWLRLASGVMLVGIVTVLWLVDRQTDQETGGWRHGDSLLRIWVVLFFGSLLAAVAVPLVFHFPWWEKIFRGDFLASFVANSAAMDSGTSTFYRIAHLPTLVRVPLALIFFLGSPFLSLGALFHGGTPVPRAFLSTGFALAFPLYAAWFFRGVLRAYRGKLMGMRALCIVYALNLAIISQASMQMRHKIPLAPLFYIVVAYGVTTPHREDRRFGWVLAMLVVLVDVGMNAFQLVGS